MENSDVKFGRTHTRHAIKIAWEKTKSDQSGIGGECVQKMDKPESQEASID